MRESSCIMHAESVLSTAACYIAEYTCKVLAPHASGNGQAAVRGISGYVCHQSCTMHDESMLSNAG